MKQLQNLGSRELGLWVETWRGRVKRYPVRIKGIHRTPPTASVSGLGSPPRFLLEGVGAGSGAAQPFSNQTPQGWRHVCDLIQSHASEGGNAECLPAPVAAVAACGFLFLFSFFPLPRGSGFSHHLANNQQVGRCLSPRRRRMRRKVQCIRLSSRGSVSRRLPGVASGETGRS